MVEYKKDNSLGSLKNMVLVMLIFIIILISGCISIKYPWGTPPSKGIGMRAMQGYPIAWNVSKEWRNDSVLSSVAGGFDYTISRMSYWTYDFISPSSGRQIGNNTVYDMLYVSVKPNGKAQSPQNTGGNNATILNWTIDSDVALHIVMNVSEVNKYINSDGVLLETFCLLPRSYCFQLNRLTTIENDDAVWHGGWRRSPEAGSPNTPYTKDIWINAHDGRVLLIE